MVNSDGPKNDSRWTPHVSMDTFEMASPILTGCFLFARYGVNQFDVVPERLILLDTRDTSTL